MNRCHMLNRLAARTWAFWLVLLTVLSFASLARAQGYNAWVPQTLDGTPAFGGGGGIMAFDAGDVWIKATAADDGLGYRGSYLSTGGVLELGSDPLSGWWLLDGRAHVSKNGGFFTNVGLVRRTYFGDTILGAGIWYSFDADQAETFGHKFHEVAVSLEVLDDAYQLRSNLYLPVGEQNYLLGTLDDSQCFIENMIVMEHGVDSALTGFDIKLTIPDQNLLPLPTTVDIGGYYYESELVQPFGGFTVGVTTYITQGFALNVTLNEDNQFDTTGFISLVWNLGGSPGLATGVHERTPVRRNDHIVRYHKDPVIATSPVTGLPYFVVHVDNSNDGADPDLPNGTGTYEDPYNQLALAEAGSSPGDIIFVYDGDGTTTGYSDGITLQDDQLLLGDGFEHVIPLAGGGEFTLCNDLDGIKPNITNLLGPAVTLADRNTVSAFTIEGADMGISGTGIESAEINNVMISQSTVHGIYLEDVTGTVSITDSMIVDNGIGNQYGVFVSVDGSASTAELDLTISGNTIDENGTGVRIEVDGSMAELVAAITDNDSISDNLSDGVFLEATGDSEVDLTFTGNLAVDRNGVDTGEGRGLFLHTDDSAITATISGNTLADNFNTQPPPANVTSGIEGLFEGDSHADLTITSNMLSGTNAADASDLLRLVYEITNTDVQELTIEDNTITDATARGLVVDVGGSTRLDAVISGNTITGSSGDGLKLATVMSSFLRVDFNNNTVSDSGGTSRFIAAGAASQFLASVTSNTFTNNGSVSSEQGVSIENRGTSVMVVDLLNNDINNNTNGGVQIFLEDNARLFAFVRNNDMTSNGAGQTDFYAEIDLGATAAAEICLQLNNNVDTTGYDLVNISNVATYNYEDDGTNLPNTITTSGPGTITQVPDGTCEAAAAPFRVFP